MRNLHDYFAVSEEEEHGESLFFNPRLLGTIPYRGASAPPLKTDEFDELETRSTARVRTFDLSQPDQLQAYEQVLHRIVNGWYVKLFDHHYFDSERKVMLVHLEWCQLYKELPPHLERTLAEESRYVG